MRRHGGLRGKHSTENLLVRLIGLPDRLIDYWSGKADEWRSSRQIAKQADPLLIPSEELRALRRAVKKQEQASCVCHLPASELSARDAELVERIREETTKANRNNVTRAKAYWNIYHRRPELHWAFLAHMATRNSGWNMTDLKGEWFSRLLSDDEAHHLFLFLERANALIFHDAFPQLRLYESSLERGRSCFHLLPAFGVSAFLRPVWEQFWRCRNPALLAVGLIINEQHYIDKNVARNPTFQHPVFDTPFFRAQSLLQLNTVLFPYQDAEKGAGKAAGLPPDANRLAGLVLEHFTDLEERIEFGKTLYAILFGVPEVRKGAIRFASSTAHTGSRADYWPHLFSKTMHHPPDVPYSRKLDGCRLLPGQQPVYSPVLAHAWPDHAMEPPEADDWFCDSDALRYFETPELPASFEWTNEFGFALQKIELAVLAKEKLQAKT
jgi:hypothetical protein